MGNTATRNDQSNGAQQKQQQHHQQEENSSTRSTRQQSSTVEAEAEAEAAAALASLSLSFVKSAEVGENTAENCSSEGNVSSHRRKFLGEAQTSAKTRKNFSRNSSDAGVNVDAAVEAETETAATAVESAAVKAAQQQRLKQTSAWSLGSLRDINGRSGRASSRNRFNWSFSGVVGGGGASSSRKKNVRSLSILQQRQRNQQEQQKQQQQQQQQQLQRSKTQWHKPLTNAIFSSHFPEESTSCRSRRSRRTRNDDFHIERLIAKGAFGVVFKVIDKRALHKQEEQQQPQQQQQQQLHNEQISKNNRKHQQQQQKLLESSQSPLTRHVYALKVLKKSKIITEHSIQQIKDEADIQKLCGHHSFIVQQIDLWQNRRNLYILSEYLPNGELFSKIAQFSIDLIRVYVAEIAIALDFLHNAGIIYRDAKPENILLTHNYHIKLIDFGLSKWLKLGATTKTLCGTFQYMAPEILRGEAYGHAVDWWSLGVIACQMFTQKSPDVRQLLQIAAPPAAAAIDSPNTGNDDDVDNANRMAILSRNGISLAGMETQMESQRYDLLLPAEVGDLPHEAKDVLKRLLEVNPKQRLRSVLGMQKIALYKNFKIDTKHLLSISPLDIIRKDNIQFYAEDKYVESSSALATKAFQDF